MSDDRQRFDNNDWHEGMTLPSRKDKHNKSNRKRKGKQAEVQKHESLVMEKVMTRDEPEVNAYVPTISEPVEVIAGTLADDHPALQELQQARAEATATSVATLNPDDDRTPHEEAAGDDVDPPPFFTTRQRVLLWTSTVLVTLFVLAWGKLGYVHNVPDLVRHNVSAYDRGPAFLVLKPWWFGPPVVDLDQYNREDETTSWDLYHARLGDYAGIVDNPRVLWYFQEDVLP